jgi:hypothetical protein
MPKNRRTARGKREKSWLERLPEPPCTPRLPFPPEPPKPAEPGCTTGPDPRKILKFLERRG